MADSTIRQAENTQRITTPEDNTANNTAQENKTPEVNPQENTATAGQERFFDATVPQARVTNELLPGCKGLGAARSALPGDKLTIPILATPTFGPCGAAHLHERHPTFNSSGGGFVSATLLGWWLVVTMGREPAHLDRGAFREDSKDAGGELVPGWKWRHMSPSLEPEGLTPLNTVSMELTSSEVDTLEAVPPPTPPPEPRYYPPAYAYWGHASSRLGTFLVNLVENNVSTVGRNRDPGRRGWSRTVAAAFYDSRSTSPAPQEQPQRGRPGLPLLQLAD
ncbi:hypothetical protein B0T24DRAFT_723973 [Lasiosphaeria ovina]|uniref:Uncharacterized protein n=1 Tax=Lasiosphaeria ovina TaxID=92902 RepID=A0AAE0JVU4_9PEZI|nr:hypothetical protein B0T24DRAFT_723973 [Lasiosphaeria ovina]